MKSNVWHPNTQMSEWKNFPEITNAKGVWLIDKHGKKLLDGVASMWCNVWGHSKHELVNSIVIIHYYHIHDFWNFFFILIDYLFIILNKKNITQAHLTF